MTDWLVGLVGGNERRQQPGKRLCVQRLGNWHVLSAKMTEEMGSEKKKGGGYAKKGGP